MSTKHPYYELNAAGLAHFERKAAAEMRKALALAPFASMSFYRHISAAVHYARLVLDNSPTLTEHGNHLYRECSDWAPERWRALGEVK